MKIIRETSPGTQASCLHETKNPVSVACHWSLVIGRFSFLWVALFFFLVWALFTHSHVGSFNDRSRLAAIESRVERGTWVIDESPFSRTVDRIFVDGHFYSDKPPVLTFIASGVYTVLHNSFHLSLDAGYCDFDESPCHCRAFCDDSPDWAYYLLTLTLVGLPSALMLALFHHMLTAHMLTAHTTSGGRRPAGISPTPTRLQICRFANLQICRFADLPICRFADLLLLTATLGLATQIFPYSTVFNSHIPAAACLLAGFYALLRAQTGKKLVSSRWLFVSGLLTALAFTFDLGVGLFLVAFFGYAVWEHRRRAWPYLLGGLLPIALMVLLDYQIVGHPLPPYMYTQGYDFPGSRFPQTIAGNRSPENVLIYGLRLLFGDHGLFALSPVLLWAVVALVRVWRERPSTGSGQAPSTSSTSTSASTSTSTSAALIGLTSGLFALYFILFTDNFGGAAYGPRWYTVFIPLLFLFVAVKRNTSILLASRQKPSAKSSFWASRLLFLALAAISFVNSYQGALNPWRAATPLLRLEYAQPGWQEPVDVALSGVTFEEVFEEMPDLLASFATRRVDKRWFDARHCLVIPPDPTWFFVGPGTPLDPALAERSGLASGGNLACYADLRPAWDAYLEQVMTSAWTSSVLVPSDSDAITPIPLPANFGGQFAFLGYELLSDEPAAGAEVALVTAWRIEGRPEPPLSIFVHLLDPQGHVSGQFDGLGANPDGLRPGDVLLHVHRFTIAPDASPGRYWLQLGLYNPETMARLPLMDQGTDRLLLTWIDVP